MDYRDNRQRWAESHQVVHFYAGQWCTFTPALTGQDGKSQTFTAGDTFVIPKGTPVVWEVTETLRKFYMIVEG